MAERSTAFGLLNVNKPAGPTSHDIVARVRRGTGIKKIGHAGTLDPMATGVLILCVGAATRLSEYVMASRKVYRARVHFGVETDTYDAEGVAVAERPADHLTREAVEAALEPFRGEIEQVPPMYSAIQQGGRRLYDLAQAGGRPQARAVTIFRRRWRRSRPCCAGCLLTETYVRSRDLGGAQHGRTSQRWACGSPYRQMRSVGCARSGDSRRRGGAGCCLPISPWRSAACDS